MNKVMGPLNRDYTKELGFYSYEEDNEVLKALHEALGIPKHDTEKMIRLLFYPWNDTFLASSPQKLSF